MIEIHLDDTLFIILEPGNFVGLKKGLPILRELIRPKRRIVIGYTPDVAWVEEQVNTRDNGQTFPVLMQIMEEAQHRPEVLR